jgi:hypothetical protein
MTHDQSFPGPSGLSINLRVKKDLLPPILYSYVLSRSIHYIVNTRPIHPSTKIFISKVDLDAAFHHCTLASSSLWGIISETLADLSNNLIHNLHWNHNDLYDNISEHLDQPLSLPDSLPFHPAKERAVILPKKR